VPDSAVAGRVALLLTIALLTALVVVLVRAWSARRLLSSRIGDHLPLWSALGTAPDGRPSLLVFSTPGCVACRTAQHPAVAAVAAQFGPALRVIDVDLATDPQVGRAFKVLTAPSTIVLSPAGRVVNVNHGFAPSERLSQQIGALGAGRAS
jgi:thiol-disulfide isomerase/thioredoxin